LLGVLNGDAVQDFDLKNVSKVTVGRRGVVAGLDLRRLVLGPMVNLLFLYNRADWLDSLGGGP
jgi:hypothetical protein